MDLEEMKERQRHCAGGLNYEFQLICLSKYNKKGCNPITTSLLYSHNRVPKQTSYVEVQKSPNLCSAIRSLFFFHHARFYCFVTPSL